MRKSGQDFSGYGILSPSILSPIETGDGAGLLQILLMRDPRLIRVRSAFDPRLIPKKSSRNPPLWRQARTAAPAAARKAEVRSRGRGHELRTKEG